MLTFSRTEVLSSIYLINWAEEENTLSLFSLVPFALAQIVRSNDFVVKIEPRKGALANSILQKCTLEAGVSSQCHPIAFDSFCACQAGGSHPLSHISALGVMSVASCAQGFHCVLEQVLRQALRGRTCGSFHT